MNSLYHLNYVAKSLPFGTPMVKGSKCLLKNKQFNVSVEQQAQRTFHTAISVCSNKSFYLNERKIGIRYYSTAEETKSDPLEKLNLKIDRVTKELESTEQSITQVLEFHKRLVKRFGFFLGTGLFFIILFSSLNAMFPGMIKTLKGYMLAISEFLGKHISIQVFVDKEEFEKLKNKLEHKEKEYLELQTKFNVQTGVLNEKTHINDMLSQQNKLFASSFNKEAMKIRWYIQCPDAYKNALHFLLENQGTFRFPTFTWDPDYSSPIFQRILGEIMKENINDKIDGLDLHRSYVGYDETTFSQLMDNLKNSKHIKSLNISNTSIGKHKSNNIKRINEFLKENNSITSLNVSYNQFTDADILNLLKDISGDKKLNELIILRKDNDPVISNAIINLIKIEKSITIITTPAITEEIVTNIK